MFFNSSICLWFWCLPLKPFLFQWTSSSVVASFLAVWTMHLHPMLWHPGPLFSCNLMWLLSPWFFLACQPSSHRLGAELRGNQPLWTIHSYLHMAIYWNHKPLQMPEHYSNEAQLTLLVFFHASSKKLHDYRVILSNPTFCSHSAYQQYPHCTESLQIELGKFLFQLELHSKYWHTLHSSATFFLILGQTIALSFHCSSISFSLL